MPSLWSRFRKRSPEPQRAAEVISLPSYDVLVFPIVDWHYRFQRPQHLSLEFARRGHRVFYFSTQFVPDFGLYNPQPRRVAPNVFTFELAGSEDPPDIYRDIPNDLQLSAMVFSIRCLQEKFGIGATVSVVDYPFWWPLVQRLTNTIVLYDCMDDYASFANAGRPARELEQEIFTCADLVVCSSAHLQQRARQRGRESALIRNAVDPGHYEIPPPSLAFEPDGRTVGCHGAIAEWTDLELLAHAARALPDKRFVLVGEVQRVDVSALEALPNVILTGEVPYERLPEYIHSFDVCVLPYRICDYALASDPMKVWEYLSAGKPVVAVRFPEIERLENVITLTEGMEQFVEAIHAAFRDNTPEKAGQRRMFTRQHTWSQRCEAMSELIAPFFPKVSVIVLAHNQFEFTRVTLESLERFSRYPNLEVLVVDNGSTDGTPDFLAGWASARDYAKVILNPRNLGFSAGNNVGARASTGDYLVFLNNDLFLTDGWISGLLAHFRDNPKLGLLGPVTNASGNESVIEINYADMEEMAVLARKYTRAHRGQRTALKVAHFFCVMAPRRVWEQVGELDEGFGLGTFEDDDYSLRVRQAGYEIACAEDVFVHHHHSASFGALPPAVYQDLFARNRRYFEAKWGPWTPPVYRPELQAKGISRERIV